MNTWLFIGEAVLQVSHITHIQPRDSAGVSFFLSNGDKIEAPDVSIENAITAIGIVRCDNETNED